MFKGFGQMDCIIKVKGNLSVRVDAHLLPKIIPKQESQIEENTECETIETPTEETKEPSSSIQDYDEPKPESE